MYAWPNSVVNALECYLHASRNWELGGCALWRHSRRHAAVTACAVICDPQSMLASYEQCTRWQKTLYASFQLWRCPSAICDR